MHRRLIPLFVFALIGCGGSGSSSKTARYVNLDSSLGTGIPTDISSDGSNIVGFTQLGQTNAPLFWKDPAIAQNYPFNIETTLRSIVAVSADGKKSLAQAISSDYSVHAVIYSAKRGQVMLAMPTGATMANPVDLSADGSVALCTDQYQSTPNLPKPYLVKNGVATYLPVPTGDIKIRVNAISGDGLTVVGSIDDKPVRWVNGGAPEFLSDQTGLASAASYDGSVIAGTFYSVPTVGFKAFRWTASQGAIDIPTAPGFESYGTVEGISGDGKTVLFSANDMAQLTQGMTFLWKEGIGTVAASDLITQSGGDASTFDGASPVALSTNGKTIVGRGKRVGTQVFPGPWKLTLP